MASLVAPMLSDHAVQTLARCLTCCFSNPTPTVFVAGSNHAQITQGFGAYGMLLGGYVMVSQLQLRDKNEGLDTFTHMFFLVACLA